MRSGNLSGKKERKWMNDCLRMEEIRNQAIRRSSTGSDLGTASTEDGLGSEEQDSTPELRRWRTRTLRIVSDDDDKEMLNRRILAREEMEERRVKIEEDCLRFECENEYRIENLLSRKQEQEHKRLRLEEKRFELEAERRLLWIV